MCSDLHKVSTLNLLPSQCIQYITGFEGKIGRKTWGEREREREQVGLKPTVPL